MYYLSELGHTSSRCNKECARCGKVGPLRICFEIEVNSARRAEMFEVVRNSVPTEPLVPVTRKFSEEGKGMK